jgi:hypothetical protein
MKKLFSMFVVLTLALTFINIPKAMAGNTNATLIQKGNQVYNPIKVVKTLHLQLGSPTVEGSVSPPQDVRILTASFQIDTWAGRKWINYKNAELHNLTWNLNTQTSKLWLYIR